MTNVESLVESARNGQKISLVRDESGRQSVFIKSGNVFNKKTRVDLSADEIIELQEGLSFKYKEKQLLDLSL